MIDLIFEKSVCIAKIVWKCDFPGGGAVLLNGNARGLRIKLENLNKKTTGKHVFADSAVSPMKTNADKDLKQQMGFFFFGRGRKDDEKPGVNTKTKQRRKS